MMILAILGILGFHFDYHSKASLYIYVLCCLINWAWYGKYINKLTLIVQKWNEHVTLDLQRIQSYLVQIF